VRNDQADAKWRNLIYFVSHPRKLFLMFTVPSAFPVAAVIQNNVCSRYLLHEIFPHTLRLSGGHDATVTFELLTVVNVKI
jgi:hypothetical protein